MSNIKKFSIRIFALDSALRNAENVSEDAENAIRELKSGKFENGKRLSISLMRNLQMLFIESDKLKGSYDKPKDEGILLVLLEKLRRESSIYLAKNRRNLNVWNTDEIIEFLEKSQRFR